jgi:hypothetical protein
VGGEGSDPGREAERSVYQDPCGRGAEAARVRDPEDQRLEEKDELPPDAAEPKYLSFREAWEQDHLED